MTFHVGGQNHPRKMEAFVSFPRRIRHTFSIETPQARFSHNEYARRFRADVRTAPNMPEEAARALAAFGMDVVGPHPRQAATAAWDRICDS